MKTRNMKTLFRIMTLFLTLFCFAGCDDDEEVLATLDVTAANLDGTWKLVEWNGAPLQEGSYCYITFRVCASIHSAARIRLIKCMISLAVCTLISRRVVLKLRKKRI